MVPQSSLIRGLLQSLLVLLYTWSPSVLCRPHLFTIQPPSIPSVQLGDVITFHVQKSEDFTKEELFEVLLENKIWSLYKPLLNKRIPKELSVGSSVTYEKNDAAPREFFFYVNATLSLYNQTLTVQYRDKRVGDAVPLLKGPLVISAQPATPTLYYTPSDPQDGVLLNATCSTSFRGLPPRKLNLQLQEATVEPSVDPDNGDSITRQFRISWLTDGQTLVCSLGPDHQATQSLRVKYGPQAIQLSLINSNRREQLLTESETIVVQELFPGDAIRCSANGQPSPLVGWYPIQQDAINPIFMADYQRSSQYFDLLTNIQTNDRVLKVRQNITQHFDEMEKANPKKRQFLFIAQCKAQNSINPNGILKTFVFTVNEPPAISNASVQIIVISVLSVVLVLTLVSIICCCVRSRRSNSTKNDRNGYTYAAINKKSNAGNNVEPLQNPSVKATINAEPAPPPPSSTEEIVYAELSTADILPSKTPKKVDHKDVIYSSVIGTLEPISSSAPPPSTGMQPPAMQPAPSSSVKEAMQCELQKQPNDPLGASSRRLSPPLKNPPLSTFSFAESYPSKTVGFATPPNPYYYPNGEPIPTEV